VWGGRLGLASLETNVKLARDGREGEGQSRGGDVSLMWSWCVKESLVTGPLDRETG